MQVKSEQMSSSSMHRTSEETSSYSSKKSEKSRMVSSKETGETSLFSSMFSNSGLETDFGIENNQMGLKNEVGVIKNDMDVFKKDFDIFNCKDSQVIHMKDDHDKFEVSLDTSQYRPDEVKILVREGVITVEGKHEEISEEGEKMVSRQFSRKYSLPPGAKPENVVSNLSSDGVLLITVVKTNLKVISTNGQAGSPKTTRVPVNLRDTFFNDSFFKSNWEEFENLQKSLQLRSNNFLDSFLENSFSASKENNFRSMVAENHQGSNQIENKIRSRNDKKQSQEIKLIMDETNLKYLDTKFDKFSPRRWMIPVFSKLDLKNNFKINNLSKDVISYKDDDTMFELKLDISEYEPEEVRVTVSPDGILVEGNHEEKSMEGKQILSRSFTRKYSLPHGVRQEDVISKFASNHVLIISAKKQFLHSQQIRIKDQSKDINNSSTLESNLKEHDRKAISKNMNSAHNLRRNVKIERVLGTSKYKMNPGTKTEKESKLANEKYDANENEFRSIKIDQVRNSDDRQDSFTTSRKDVPINIGPSRENKNTITGKRTSKIEKKLEQGQTNVEMKHETQNIQISKQKTTSVNCDINKDLKPKPVTQANAQGMGVNIFVDLSNEDYKKSEDEIIVTDEGAQKNIDVKYATKDFKISKDMATSVNYESERNRAINISTSDIHANKQSTEVNMESQSVDSIRKNKQTIEDQIETSKGLVDEKKMSKKKPEDVKDMSKKRNEETYSCHQLKNEYIHHSSHLTNNKSGTELTEIQVNHQIPPKSKEKNVSESEDAEFSEKYPSGIIWGLPSILNKDLDLFQDEDSQVIRIVNNERKFEVSLDTSQYRPDELMVKVAGGTITIEGKHEEESEDGMKMVSRQFSKKYSLPEGAQEENVVSNLSSDGVLVITVDKTNLKFRSEQYQIERQSINNVGTLHQNQEEKVPITLRNSFYDDQFFKTTWDNFESMKTSMTRESEEMWKRIEREFNQMQLCMLKDTSQSEYNKMTDSGKMAISLEDWMRESKLNSKQRSSLSSIEESNTGTKSLEEWMSEAKSNRMNKSMLSNNEQSKKMVKSFKEWRAEALASLQSEHQNAVDRSSFLDRDMMVPRKWMIPNMVNNKIEQLGMFQTEDSQVIKVKNDDEMFEVSLDTSQYSPDELKVNVDEGIIAIEGKHEEKSEDGRKMVSRQFSRKYSLPAGAKAECVVSKLSSDGVLIISAPKNRVVDQRRIPITSD